ncbi:MAG: DUF1801 domain-containing protein [Bacteroidia bacterium]|jgi:uncharacterized protein YdhG (YjbR/CyaY superfamily)
MKSESVKFINVDQYIETFPVDVQKLLQELRNTIRQAAPNAEECISYNMPAYKLNGVLVYFAGNKKHIGFYPIPSAIEHFSKQLLNYTTSKGAIQFQIEEGIPKRLVQEIVKFRVKENQAKLLKK